MPNIKSINGHCFDIDRLNPGSIIVEAGACVGSSTQVFRKYTDCKIFMIEPNKRNCEEAKSYNYKNVEIIQRAFAGHNVGNKVQFVSYISKQANYKEWGNIVGKVQFQDGGHKPEDNVRIVKYDVETIKINDVFDFLKIDKIDFLKMDIEESEYGVIKTMSRETADKIDQISYELHSDDWLEFMTKKLTEFGFKVFFIPKELEVYATKDHSVKYNDIPKRED
jgi:FkbM family methyltransferase